MVFTRNTSYLRNINVQGLESVTLSVRSLDSFTDHTVPRAQRKELAADLLLDEGGEFRKGDLAWQLWDVGLDAGVAPSVGDRITDSAGVVYEVRGVTTPTLGGYWECVTVQDAS